MRILHRHQSACLQVVFSPTGNVLASVALGDRIRIQALTDDYLVQFLPGGRESIIHYNFIRLAISSTQGMLAAGKQNGTVNFYDFQAPAFIGSAPTTQLPYFVTSLMFLNDGRYLAVASSEPDHGNGTAYIVDCQNQKNIRVVRELSSGSYVCGITALPKSKTCYYIEGLRRVRKCDLSKSDQIQSAAYAKPIRELAINRRGTTLAVAHDYAIDILDAETLQRQKTLSGHKGRVDSLAFLPDGRLLSGSWDKTVRLWDVDSGRELSAHDWDIGGIRSVAASPDGLLAAAGGDSGAIVLWDLDE